VNHFKSKGSGVDDGTGQGNANPDRVEQAEALAAWVPGVAAETGTDAVLLAGDFNAYSMEDPMQVLHDAGYTNTQTVSDEEEWSYSFSGLSGSLDHVLANDAALAAVTGVDIWNINSGESVAMEYSRWNYHGTDFHDAGPFRSSDHDPVKVGLDLVADAPETAPSRVLLKVRPKQPKAGKGKVTLKVTVRSSAGVPTGTVTVEAGGKEKTATLDKKGRATLRMRNPFRKPGEYTITASYAGDEAVAASEKTKQLTVRR
jgi:hypothetical protein